MSLLDRENGYGELPMILLLVGAILIGTFAIEYRTNLFPKAAPAPEPAEISISCQTDSDCGCGFNTTLNKCAASNTKYLENDKQCFEYCNGKNNNLGTKCVSNRCTQVII